MNEKAAMNGALIELVDIRKVYQMGVSEVNALDGVEAPSSSTTATAIRAFADPTHRALRMVP